MGMDASAALVRGAIAVGWGTGAALEMLELGGLEARLLIEEQS